MSYFVTGSVYVGNGRWTKNFRVEDGTIVGIDVEQGSSDVALDYSGKFLFPAFEDAHTHPGSRCRMLQELDLREAKSWSEASEQIRRWIAAHPGRETYIVHGWNTTTWGMLSESMLNEVTEAPLFLMDIAYHFGVMNTPMRSWVEFHQIHPIMKDGLVYEAEFDKVALATFPGVEALKHLIPTYIKYLHSLGVGAVHDVYLTKLDQLDAYQELDREGKLTMPVLGLCEPDLLTKEEVRDRLQVQGRNFHIKGLKLFMDGAIGGHTAALSHPYSDVDHGSEILLTRETFLRVMSRTVELGLTDVGVHAIGDAAVSKAIDWMVEAKAQFPSIAVWRIEHAEMISDADVARVVEHGIWLVMQPNFHWDLGNYRDRLDDSAMKLINPFRTLLDRGARVAFGSDGMPEGPLIGLDYAFTKSVYPSQSITRHEGIAAYTTRPAELAGAKKRGTLLPGNEASFLALDQNILEDGVSARATKVLETWVAGKKVWPV